VVYSDEVKNGRFSELSKNQRALLPAVAEGRIVFFGRMLPMLVSRASRWPRC
jgi:hypothetical protein